LAVDCVFNSLIRLLIGFNCELYPSATFLKSLLNCCLMTTMLLSALSSFALRLVLASISACLSSAHEKHVLSCSLIEVISLPVATLYCVNLSLIALMSMVACVLYCDFSLSIVFSSLLSASSSRLIKLSTRVLPISPEDKRAISSSQRLIFVSKRTMFSSSTCIFAVCSSDADACSICD